MVTRVDREGLLGEEDGHGGTDGAHGREEEDGRGRSVRDGTDGNGREGSADREDRGSWARATWLRRSSGERMEGGGGGAGGGERGCGAVAMGGREWIG